MDKTMQIPVSEIMTRDLIIVSPEDKLTRVDEIFRSNNIHHIPVVNPDGSLCGIMSKADFSKVNHMLSLFDEKKYGDYNKKLYRAMTVKEVMTCRVATLHPKDTLTVAAGILQENLFHALPVVDKGVLVGLVTTYDLLNYCLKEPVYLENKT